MEMHWPQITYIAVNCIGIGLCIRDGEGFESIASAIVVYFLLYSGGFFTRACP